MADLSNRASLAIQQEHLEELVETFQTIDADGNGFIAINELGNALHKCGFKVPQYQVRQYIRDYDNKIVDDKIDFEEFKQLYARLKQDDYSLTFKKMISKNENVESHGGMSQASNQETTHTVGKEEQVAFTNWINSNLSDDPDCKSFLPMGQSGDLFQNCKNGILLCKMINRSQPDTIDERSINKTNLSVYRIHENLTLALNSARSIGCNVVNIGADDLERGKPHLVLGLLWQIIRIGLLSDINLHDNPGLVKLLREDETLDDLRKLSPEQILIRWVNYHLDNSGCGRQVSNLNSDIKDSVAYIHLLHQIAPRDKGVHTGCQNEIDLERRAELMLQESDKIGCRSFVSPKDVVNGITKLNLAFVANLFNMYPSLGEPEGDFDFEQLEETREEKTYRNWMNSMGVNPYVNNLYSDLMDGIIIFQLYDIIKPGIVNWSRVKQKLKKMTLLFDKIENCNYAVELGNELKFSLVGIGGKDIADGLETLTLALVWQLMRAYTFSILQSLKMDEDQSGGSKPILEKEIIAWANDTLRSAGKSRQISGFNDPSISNARVVLDLIDAVKPGSVTQNNIKDGDSDEDKLSNAKYAISTARKIGARVYALPEDLVEVKQKMVLTVFACLMIKDLQPSMKNK